MNNDLLFILKADFTKQYFLFYFLFLFFFLIFFSLSMERPEFIVERDTPDIRPRPRISSSDFTFWFSLLLTLFKNKLKYIILNHVISSPPCKKISIQISCIQYLSYIYMLYFIFRRLQGELQTWVGDCVHGLRVGESWGSAWYCPDGYWSQV